MNTQTSSVWIPNARTNTYAILAAATGQVMDTATFPTSLASLKRAIAWNDRRSDPGLCHVPPSVPVLPLRGLFALLHAVLPVAGMA
ncbi:hypothetical protein [Arthrobacter psychrochitiniphilus]|uniref:hypothetical protein n=1 Tax=Arthrobacter psychrochitiniphilus TaxID=291045 RepID=UPI0011B3CBAE|nr:hypothetical protein [Arthrobacter psychrochitiniphilus]NYG16065.1 hypothetical protein [Arthrobacter psychrochitiniphilus]